ncbi:MAG: hypothetical protein AB8H79_00790 [Myxococcota bacterium]
MSPRAMKEGVWRLLTRVGREVLTALLSAACWRETKSATQGTTPRLRLDDDYTISQSTTRGVLRIPLFA